ncbi:MAG: response regulator transcription factor [Proteobacteria bacterium]|nr:response regulator transcription factor [Burkholderiales bacterium]
MDTGANEPTVFLIDDDPSVLKSLTRLLRSEHLRVEAFASAEAFLAECKFSAPGCLVLDLNLPGLDGLALQRRLRDAGSQLPIVFLTGEGDIPITVRALQAGAVDFLTKPVTATALLAAVKTGIERDTATRLATLAAGDLQQRFSRLTDREREVLYAVAAGKLNKQIAADLGIAEQTVKFHRARIMERTNAKTTAELMAMAATLGVSPHQSASRRD